MPEVHCIQAARGTHHSLSTARPWRSWQGETLALEPLPDLVSFDEASAGDSRSEVSSVRASNGSVDDAGLMWLATRVLAPSIRADHS